MAAPLTLVASTAEQQTFEICNKLAVAITAYQTANPSADLKGMRVTRSLDVANSRATFSIVLPLTQIVGVTDGGLELDAEAVLA
jgi:hypothetical protein